MIELRLLGGLRLRDPEGKELSEVLEQPKRLALLSYLVLARRGDFQRRDTLLPLFWPELDQARARSALNQALQFLRRALGKEIVISRGREELGIARERLWCDAVAFEEALERDELETALQFYKGDLLEGLHVAEAMELDQWLEAERLRLRERAASAATQLADRFEAGENGEAAVGWARRALEFSAYDEGRLRRLIALLDQSGDRAAAVRAYEAFARRLQEDLQVKPSPETQALIERIRAREEIVSPGGAEVSGSIAEVEQVGHRKPQPSPEAVLDQADARAGAQPQGGRPRVWRLTRRWLAGARIYRATVLLALLAGGALAVAFSLSFLEETASFGEVAGTTRVLVVALKNETGDSSLAPVGRMAMDWITRGLAETGLVEVVTSASTGIDSDTPNPPPGDRAALVRALAERTGAHIVVWGAYYGGGDSLHMHAQLLDPSDGRVLRALEPLSAPLNDPTASIESLRQRVVGSLATIVDPKLAQWAGKASQPPSYAAYRQFIDGITMQTVHDGLIPRSETNRGALDHFYRAAAYDSTFTQPLLWAARIHRDIREFETADSILSGLNRLRHTLPPLDRAMVDVGMAALRGDRLAVLKASRRVARIAPGAEELTNAGMHAIWVNRPREAVEFLEATDPERGWLRYWFPYWETLTWAYHMLGQHEPELAAAQRARELFVEDDPRPLRAEARALAALGRLGELQDRVSEFWSVCDTSAMRRASCGTLRAVAQELRAHGYPHEADAVLSHLIDWLEGHTAGVKGYVPALASLTIVYVHAARWDDARRLCDRILKEEPESVVWRGRCAHVAAVRGDREEALRVSTWLEELTPAYNKWQPTLYRARIASALGERDQAVALLRQALREGYWPLYLHAQRYYEDLWNYPPFQELIRPKG